MGRVILSMDLAAVQTDGRDSTVRRLARFVILSILVSVYFINFSYKSVRLGNGRLWTGLCTPPLLIISSVSAKGGDTACYSRHVQDANAFLSRILLHINIRCLKQKSN